jgi:hypothetical protein
MNRRIRSNETSSCFLCDPEPEYTWANSEHFRAILGIGPVGEGFTLIAAREHESSMLDVPSDQVDDLIAFTDLVRRRLDARYGSTVVAEHGRIAPCVEPGVQKHEPHCLHAHRLVFTGASRIDLAATAPRMEICQFADFETARDYYEDKGQYLYVEDDDGVQVGRIDGPLPRQFLRAIVALEQGRPHLADWRKQPGFDQIEAAQHALGLPIPA